MEKATQLPSGRWRQRYAGPDGSRHSTTDTSERKVQKKAALELVEKIANHGKQQERERGLSRFDLFAETWLHMRRPGQPDGYSPGGARALLLRVRIADRSACGPNGLRAQGRGQRRMTINDLFNSQREVAAAHEAAHAICYLAFGYPIHHIEIEPDCVTRSTPTPVRRPVWDLAVVSMAGMVIDGQHRKHHLPGPRPFGVCGRNAPSPTVRTRPCLAH